MFKLSWLDTNGHGDLLEGEYEDLAIARDTAMNYYADGQLEPTDIVIVWQSDDGETWLHAGVEWTAGDFLN